MSRPLPCLTLLEGGQKGPMLRRKPPEPARPPDPQRTIWTNVFGETMGGVALVILGGVVWLVISLPAQLGEIKGNQGEVLKSLEKVHQVQEKHETWLQDHERRLIREEEAMRQR